MGRDRYRHIASDHDEDRAVGQRRPLNRRIVTIANSLVFKELVFNYSGEFANGAKVGWGELIYPYRVHTTEIGSRVFLVANDNQGKHVDA